MYESEHLRYIINFIVFLSGAAVLINSFRIEKIRKSNYKKCFEAFGLGNYHTRLSTFFKNQTENEERNMVCKLNTRMNIVSFFIKKDSVDYFFNIPANKVVIKEFEPGLTENCVHISFPDSGSFLFNNIDDPKTFQDFVMHKVSEVKIICSKSQVIIVN